MRLYMNHRLDDVLNQLDKQIFANSISTVNLDPRGGSRHAGQGLQERADPSIVLPSSLLPSKTLPISDEGRPIESCFSLRFGRCHFFTPASLRINRRH